MNALVYVDIDQGIHFMKHKRLISDECNPKREMTNEFMTVKLRYKKA